VDQISVGVTKLLEELSVQSLSGQKVTETQMTLTNYSFFLIIAAVVTIVVVLYAVSKVKLVPESRVGSAMESAVEFVRDGLIVDIMGKEGIKYLPFIGTVFFFVLFNNFIGLIPGFKPGTGTMGTTVAWALIVFVMYHSIGIKKNGFFPYLKHYVPKGVNIGMGLFIGLLELISDFIRPLTLSVRLFANMYAGHITLGIFSVFTVLLLEASGAVKAIAILPLALQIVMYGFEVFVAFLQAYIFSILTAVYIGGALHATEH